MKNSYLSRKTKILKFVALLCFVFGVITKTAAQCTGPYARFESIGSSTANTTGFTFTTSGVGSTVGVARSGKYYFQDGAVNSALTSPQIDNPKSFSFYVKCNNTLATYILEYSINAGAWTDATPYATSTPPSVSTSWQLVSYDFNTATFNSTNVKFRIRDTYTRGTASTLYLDDISWTCYVSGTASTVGTGYPENTTVGPVQNGNGTPSACSGTTVVLDTYPNGGSYNSFASYNFYDNGGATDEYSANQINQVTFKPTASGYTAGDRIRIQFISYAVGNTGDTIEIWDDNGGSLNGTTNLLAHNGLAAPTITTYISTISSDGSLTIKFTSDGATNAAGFNIKVDCIRCNAAPSGLAASAVGSTTASLTWSNTPAAPYDIYYSTSNATQPLGGNVTPQGVNLGTNSYDLTGLAINTTYYVWVRSKCGSSPDSYGPWSSSINFTTADCSPFVIATSPSTTIQNLCLNATSAAFSASATGGTVLSYQWYSNTANSNAGGSSILGANSSSYSPLTTSTGTLYYYCVITSTISCIVTSAVSGPVIVTTVPSAPTASAGSGATTSAITANWASLAGATGYYLDVATDSGFTSMVSGYNNLSVGNVITYNVTGLSSGTTYYYRVRAANTCGSGTSSGTIITTTLTNNALTNDDPCSAISLTVSTTCSYSTYTNSGAAASGGITAPGCANYIGSDVWFSAVVPATGVLTVDLQSGVITDSGMAFYSGTCGSLTLLECDDDDSTNGLMSNISMVGLTPGQTIFIRVWEYGNNNNGTFGICATTPSCPPPSDLYANILSTTSATINWANTTPPASNGYQYYITTTNTPPTTGSTPTGSTAAGVNGVTLTGLVSGQVYYFWVRAYCGGTDYSSWFGPTNYTPCAVGSGSGTTTLSCPSVVAGGLGLSSGNPAAVACSASTCTNLEATYLQLNQATDYTVASIPYAPPYQYSCLQNPVSVNVDDKWSPIINLPFNFCFYGNNYNKCLIGSNGTITFDTTSNIPGGYSNWSFNADLPNTSLFKNTIFGVYHDIDPGIGGKVSWELITLNTGCRALVASWHDIPMFSSTCNSSLYTGMIVLYENTNVIDLFIKEKNICATWNNGNAIVGIQNLTGTAAVVAPNRNGLSTNWAVTDEAWRFTPSGPSLTSIKWYEGNGTTGTVVGTTDIVTVCPSVTTVYTAEVTYALCSGTNLKYTDNVLVTVTGTKIWDGSTNTNWNIDDNWTPSGVPTSADCVVIPDVANDPVISGAPNAVGYNLLLYSNALLTINSNQNLTITDKVTVQTGGIFTINNSASLIQINNVLNSGNITYKRESPNIRTLDYVYWSSPVANFNISNIVSPYSFGAIYTWNTTIPNSNAGWGTWQNFSGTMVTGKGYIARSPGTAPFNNTTFNVLSGSFTGVPNNGNITVPIERGPDQNTATHYGTNGTQITNLSDNWNLLGNPYPSAIRASQFLFDNNTKIEGNVRLWTHGQLPTNIVASPFYGSFISNYSPGDYLTYNFTGTSCCPAAASDLFIGAAQGFFVQMVDGPAVAAAANVTVGFTNSLRSATYSNSTFYKMQNSTISASSDITNIERNRIWLDLVNPNNQTDRTLFGYIENATMGTDSFYDCVTQNTGGTLIYSLIDDTKFSIQGRALPFDINDEVPIGLNIPTQGNYKIAIAGVDGFFTSQNIYLKDNLLNIIHDIRVSPYEFTTSTGMINERFRVIYINNALGNPDLSFDNTIKVMTDNEVAVSSSNLNMESIDVFNLLGQKLNTYTNINANYTILSGLHKNNTTLFLKIKLDTGETVTKKIIY